MSGVLLAVATALAVGGGCREAPAPPPLSAAQQREWSWLQTTAARLTAQRAELARWRSALAEEEGAVTAADPRRTRAPSSAAAPAARRAALAGRIAARERTIAEGSERFGARLVDFLAELAPRGDRPAPPARQQAIRLKSVEDMAVAAEWIERGGDYRRAIEIYETQRAHDPDYQPLGEALRRAREMRRVTARRFAQLSRGMTASEVRARLGPVNLRLVRSFPERDRVMWLYPQERGGTAAVVFRRDPRRDLLLVEELTFELPAIAPLDAGQAAQPGGGDGGPPNGAPPVP